MLPSRQYDNFDIHLLPRESDGSYPVSVAAPTGPAQARMRLPYADEELKRIRERIEQAVLNSAYGNLAGKDLLKQEGRRLLEAILTEDVLIRWVESRAIATAQGRGMRVRLLMQEELAGLPWEVLYDPWQRNHLAPESRTPLSRYLAQPGPVTPLKVDGPLKIVAMAVPLPSSEGGFEELQTEREQTALEDAVKRLQAEGIRVDLNWVGGRKSHDDLRQSLAEWEPHIFHFIGHGGFDEEQGGYLALGEGTRLHAGSLAVLLANTARPAVVILNSCEGARGAENDPFSSMAWFLAYRGVPAVVAMQYRISNDAATQFSSSLYHALARYEPIDAAVASARHDVEANQYSLEWTTAVLYMSSPDGRVLEPRERVIELPPDGGRYGSLERAVEEIAAGGTVSLQAGTYELKRGVLLHPPVRIIGAGKDHTVIRAEAGAQVLRVDGEGVLMLRDLTVESAESGVAGTDALSVTGSTVDIAGCCFRGARAPAAGHLSNAGPGAGLRLQGGASGTVADSSFTDNEYGIVLSGADVLLTRNFCERNRLDGLYYVGESRGTAQDNTCNENGKCGILIVEHADPTIERNVCERNGVAGLAIGDFSQAVARENTCSENTGSGIMVLGSALPTIENNSCVNNQEAGIVFMGASAGIARHNQSVGNGFAGKRKDGIVVREEAGPQLDRNERRDR